MNWTTYDKHEYELLELIHKPVTHDRKGIQEDLARSKRIWNNAVLEGVTEKLAQYVGACFALYHAYHETPRELLPSLRDSPQDIVLRVLDMALEDGCSYYLDVIMELYHEHADGIYHALLRYDWTTEWLVKCFETPDERVDPRRAVNHPGVVHFLPYIGGLGPELYQFCGPEGFERIRGTIGCEDHYLANKVSEFCNGPLISRLLSHRARDIASLVGESIDRQRAMGIAMDHWKHWVLLTEEERLARARAYGVNLSQVDWFKPKALERFVCLLYECELDPSNHDHVQLARSLSHLTKVVEPDVPWPC